MNLFWYGNILDVLNSLVYKEDKNVLNLVKE